MILTTSFSSKKIKNHQKAQSILFSTDFDLEDTLETDEVVNRKSFLGLSSAVKTEFLQNLDKLNVEYHFSIHVCFERPKVHLIQFYAQIKPTKLHLARLFLQDCNLSLIPLIAVLVELLASIFHVQKCYIKKIYSIPVQPKPYQSSKLPKH